MSSWRWAIAGAGLCCHVVLAAEAPANPIISLNFQDIEIRAVLQILADDNHLNLVVSDKVTGHLSLHLQQVKWQQALDTILELEGLASRRHGRILLVAPAAELAAREVAFNKANTQAQQTEPLHTQVFALQYAHADELAALLQKKEQGLISAHGAVAVDERTNTLLVHENTHALAAIGAVVKRLDKPVPQVVIAARVVTLNEAASDELGLRWGITAENGDFATSGHIEGLNNTENSDNISLDQHLNVNLPVANAAGSIALQLARLADDKTIDLELSALEAESKGEIVASPRLTTTNNKPAYIEQGVEIPYEESSSSGATSVTYKKAVLSLRVTPVITPDEHVRLHLVITQDTQGASVPTANGGDAVAIDTQEISTNVLAANGQTIVLGGIYQREIVDTVTKVPGLGDVPVLGRLFQRRQHSNQKREVLIFVTPHIKAGDI